MAAESKPKRERPLRPAGMMLAAASAVIALWFLAKIVSAILLFFFAIVVAIALSAPVDWFVRRGMSRRQAALLVLVAFFATLGLVGWLVIPELAGQIVILVNSLPQLIGDINAQVAKLLAQHPELQGVVAADATPLDNFAPSAANLFRGVGNASLSVLGGIALFIIFLSALIYVVIAPRPLLRAYLGTLPRARRLQGVRAYRRASAAVVGWTEASLIVGTIEFVLVFAFLTYMGLPGVLIWAALAFFAEFIPRIGGYLMAFPPVVVALTLGPMTALWVALFYLAMNELLGNLVAPRIRGQTMAMHPVMLLFFTLAFALAFGLLGALVATPAAAFFATFSDEFYMKRARPGFR